MGGTRKGGWEITISTGERETRDERCERDRETGERKRERERRERERDKEQ